VWRFVTCTQLPLSQTRGSSKGQFPRAVSRADRQLVYIESYSPPLLPSSSLLSLVSSISAIYKAPFSRIAFCTCRHEPLLSYKISLLSFAELSSIKKEMHVVWYNQIRYNQVWLYYSKRGSPNIIVLLNYRKVGSLAFENCRVLGWYK
jgi:hypothetical protein